MTTSLKAWHNKIHHVKNFNGLFRFKSCSSSVASCSPAPISGCGFPPISFLHEVWLAARFSQGFFLHTSMYVKEVNIHIYSYMYTDIYRHSLTSLHQCVRTVVKRQQAHTRT